MRKNYHFIPNQEEPDSNRIREYQDFAALLAAHEEQSDPQDEKRPARVRPLRVVLAAVAAVAAGLALLWMMRTGTVSAPPAPEVLAQESAAFFAERQAIQPVLPDLEVPRQEVTVASATGAEIDLNAQTRMRIPATAFVDTEGNAVTGEVQITYRTLNDQADLLVSGLPMEYTAGDDRFQLSAAGVVEVSAFQDGQQVQLAPDKTLELTLVEAIELAQGEAVAPREVLYWGQEQQWISGEARAYTAQTQAASLAGNDSGNASQQDFMAAKETLRGSLEEEKQQILAELTIPEPPVAPEGGSGDRPSFELDLASDNAIQLVGELANNRSAVTGQKTWVVSEKSADFDLRALTVVWETITVEALNDQEYRMTFRAGEAADEVIVQPLLSPEAYAAAMEAYRQELAQWEENKDSIEARRQERFAALTARYAAREAELETEYRQQSAGNRGGATKASVRTEVVHTFSIPRLGIWSCVQPFTTDHEVVIAGLTRENGASIDNKVAYLIDRTENTVYRFHAAGQGALLRFREKPDSDFVICVPLDEQRIAIVSGPDLAGESSVLTLTEQPQVGSVEEMKRLLAI